MLTLHDNLASGNAYKVRLLLSHIGKKYVSISYDVTKDETRTPEFLAKNSNGRIPVLEFDDGRCLAESNAILYYLALNTNYLPADPWEQALVMQWMFFEQYSHEPYVAVAKFILTLLPTDSPRRTEIPRLQAKGYEALSVMEQHLRDKTFFVGERYTIADIALFAYTHKAEMGGFELERFPAIRQWLERVEQQPNFVAMYP